VVVCQDLVQGGLLLEGRTVRADRSEVENGVMLLGTLALVLAVLAAPLVVQAQKAEKAHRIGVLAPGALPRGEIAAFRTGLQELGYIEGQNVRLEWRSGDGNNERLQEVTIELVRLNVDVIFAVNTQAVKAAKNATATIPIVMVRVAEPVRSGLVQSLARPGGNVTGITAIPDELSGKRLQLLREVFPRIARAAVLWTAGNPGAAIVAKTLQHEGEKIGVRMESLGLRRPDELPAVIQTAVTHRAEALVLSDDILITAQRAQILAMAERHRLPVVTIWRGFAEAGALMSYGPSEAATFRRAAFFVHKILRGAKAADLPVEQPTVLELVINLGTAKRLGLTIPASLLLRAGYIVD
jgi:putative ABC transport system substrate-binding protein